MRLFKAPKNVGDVEVVENVRVDVTEAKGTVHGDHGWLCSPGGCLAGDTGT